MILHVLVIITCNEYNNYGKLYKMNPGFYCPCNDSYKWKINVCYKVKPRTFYRKCNCRHNHGDNNGMKFKVKKKLMISLFIFVSAVRHESWADWFKLIKRSTQLRFNTKLMFFIFIVQNSYSRQNCAKIWGCQGSKVL